MYSISKILNVRLYSTNLPVRNILAPLNNRSLLRVSGSEVKDFLQGLITNDMYHLGKTSGGSIYAMFLNAKGRVMYDTIIYKPGEKNTYFVECDNDVIKSLEKHLKMFRVRKKIDISSLQDEYMIHTVYNTKNIKTQVNTRASNGELEGIVVPCDQLRNTQPETSTSTTIYNKLLIFRDPRVMELGSRIISKVGTDVKQELSGFLEVTDCPEPHDSYKALRYSLGVGEGPYDLPPDNCFPLECNCDYLHGVSFHKGCYIGQELTARTHHTGIIRKRLMPLFFSKIPSILPKDNNILQESTKLGKLRGTEDDLGLALLRISSALEIGEFSVGDGVAKVYKPHWWPLEAPKEKLNVQKS
ncbi:unnamed protein product [Phaedon cochleariae]|uniref:CAF17 C-terminal domain-containing protein n=1 Tax=Phaedon cochleariae TaxID=80249 RepID=A0A9N9X1D0_PHACE|nr:unnamed protein product [Phaedon cochleariae]